MSSLEKELVQLCTRPNLTASEQNRFASFLDSNTVNINALYTSIVTSDEAPLLYIATKSNNIDAIKILLSKGADVNVTTKNSKSTSLHAACYYAKLEAIDELLKGNSNSQYPDTTLKNAYNELCNQEFLPDVSKQTVDLINQKINDFKNFRSRNVRGGRQENRNRNSNNSNNNSNNNNNGAKNTLSSQQKSNSNSSNQNINSTQNTSSSSIVSKTPNNSSNINNNNNNNNNSNNQNQFVMKNYPAAVTTVSSFGNDDIISSQSFTFEDRCKLHDLVEELILLCETTNYTEAKFLKVLNDVWEHMNNDINCLFDAPWSPFLTTLLHEAAKTNNAALATLLIQKKGASVNLQLSQLSNRTPLHYACYSGNSDVIKVLAENGADPFVTDFGGISCVSVINNSLPEDVKETISEYLFGYCPKDDSNLDYAALELCNTLPCNQVELLRLLNIDHSVLNKLIPYCEDDETTLLYSASRSNNVEAVEILLNLGADPRVIVPSGNTPLHVACYRGYLEVVDLLLNGNCYSQKPDLAVKNNYGETPISIFSPSLGDSIVSQIISKVGLPPKELLALSAGKGDLNKLQNYLAMYPNLVNLSFQDPSNAKGVTTLLDHSIRNRCVDAAEIIIIAGADPASSINTALEVGDHQLIKLLVRSGVDPQSIKDKNKYPQPIRDLIDELIFEDQLASFTPSQKALYSISQQGDSYLTKFLSQSPNTLNTPIKLPGSSQACTLLYEAAKQGNFTAVKYLLDQLANVNAPNPIPEKGVPLHAACYYGHESIVQYLIDNGADIEATNSRDIVPGGEFDPSVSEAKRQKILQILAKQKADLALQRSQQQLQDYIQSLKNRSIILPSSLKLIVDTSNLNSMYVKSLKMFRLTGLQDVCNLLAKVAANIIKSYIGGLYTQTFNIQQQNMDPVTQQILISLFSEFTLQYSEYIKANLESQLYPVTIPHIFPLHFYESIKTEAQSLFEKHLSRISNSILIAYSKSNIALHGKFSSVIKSPQPLSTMPLLLQRAFDISQFLVTECETYLTRIVNQNPKIFRISRTFILTRLLPALINEYRSSVGLAPSSSCIISSVNEKNTISSLFSFTTLPVIDVFLQDVIANYRLPSFSTLKPRIESVIKDGKIGAFHKLCIVDNLILKAIVLQITSLFNTYVQTLNQSTSTAQEYFRSVLMGLIDAAEREYQKLGEQMCHYNIPASLNIQNELSSIPVLRSFIEKLQKTTVTAQFSIPINPKSILLFNQEYASLLQKLNSQQMITVPQVLEYLRAAHLNRIWLEVPAYAQSQEILSSFQSNDVTLIDSPTGSGKSTVVPQYLQHKTGNRVMVTQPRREPTQSVGKHVKVQYGDENVGYEMGGVQNPSPNAPLQYATDALLEGKIITNPGNELKNGMIVIIDEVHERSSTIDNLFLVLLHLQKIMKQKGVNFKIGLASATVDPVWFSLQCSLFSASFHHIKLDVKSPFPVQDALPVSGSRMQWPEDPNNKPNRSLIAARDAFTLALKNKHCKILVFLPLTSEIVAAETEFQKLSGGRISCAGIHAHIQGVGYKLQNSRVIFANKIAESSITIPGLTHVMDFNLTVIGEVNPIENNQQLVVELCTFSSYHQRRGRVGRKLPGTYIPYYIDPNNVSNSLPKYHKSGIELLSNDHILRIEARLNYFLQVSLFSSGNLYPPLGKGIIPRIIELPSTNITSLYSSKLQSVKFGALLNLPNGLRKAFNYAYKHKTCPLAILWLSAILESRDPPTPFGVPFPNHFANRGLGVSGDFGLLLELFRSYVIDKENAGKAFDIISWCKNNGSVSNLFLEIVESRIEAVKIILKSIGNIDLKDSPSSWTVDQLEDALVAGYWRNSLKRVDHNLKTHDLISPYRQLDSTQQLAIRLSNKSIWFNSPSGTLPQYLIYYTMDKNGSSRFVNYIMEVKESTIDKHTKNRAPVFQSIGFVYSTYLLMEPWLEINQHRIHKLNIKGKNQQPTSVFSKPFCERNPNTLNHIYCEVIFKGSRIEVGDHMDQCALELVFQLNNQNSLNSAPNFSNFSSINQPSSPVSIADLSKLDKSLGSRLADATLPRPVQTLISDLKSGDKQKIGIAICNILIHDLDCTPKGGIVRDIIVRNLRKFEDIDLNLSSSITQNNWQSQIADFCSHFKRKYQYNVVFKSSRPSHGKSNGIIVLEDENSIEYEMIAPWNTPFFSPTCMDMTVNNLCLKPNSQNLEPIINIGMSTLDIVKQLLVSPKPQASPLYNIEWIAGSGPKTGEGISRKRWVVCDKTISNPDKGIMEKRLKKMRMKGYWLVETTCIPNAQSNFVVLYHGTSSSAAKAILSSQKFLPGKSGNLGPGVYMSRDTTICKMFGTHLLSAKVSPGSVITVQGFVGSKWHAPGIDTAFLPKHYSPRSLEEWCMAGPNYQITNITQILP